MEAGSRCRMEGRRFSGNSGCEAERLFEERASLRNRPLRGVSLPEEKTSRREQRGRGDLDGREFGAVTEPVRMVSGCGRPPHREGSTRKGFWTPIRSPAASASPGRTGGRGRSVSKPPLRPDSFRPDASRYLCGRSRFHPPGAGASDATPGRKSLPAAPQPRPIVCIRKMPKHPFGRDLFRRGFMCETDANHCHTDANHCHILPPPAQSAPKTLSSSPEP